MSTGASTIIDKKAARKIDIERFLGLIAVCILTGLFVGTMATRSMPVAEGWYTRYSEMINEGKVVYKDFSFLFYPFYINFIAVFTKIFGYSILSLRILGAVFFVGIGVTVYFICLEFAKPLGSAAAAVLTTLYVQSEVVQVFYDYIRLMDLCAYLAVLFLIKLIKTIIAKDRKKVLRNALLTGLFAALACMIKQSTGMLLIVYIICLFLFLLVVSDKERRKIILRAFLGYIASVAAVFIIMIIGLAVQGALGAFFNNANASALGAKGGLMTVLFRWILIQRYDMEDQVLPTLIFMIVISFFAIISRKGLFRAKKDSRVINIIMLISYVLILAGLIIAMTQSRDVAEFCKGRMILRIRFLAFVCPTLFFVRIGVCQIYEKFLADKLGREIEGTFMFEKDESLTWFAFAGAIFAIGYGVGISGGLTESQVALGIAFVFAMFFNKSEGIKFGKVLTALVLIWSISFSVGCCGRKYVQMYNWWGLDEYSYWDATHESQVPLLKGIKMTYNDATTYDGVYKIVTENTKEGDEIFCFPHIPIFYTLTGHGSSTYTQVQWFDMSSMDAIKKDIEYLKEHEPKVIIDCVIPEGVTDGHESAFNDGKKSHTTVMAEYLSEIEASSYRHEGSFFICPGYFINVYVHD